ncbi:restriction endonuclease subunit S [Actinacidiphila sp. bgisy160]|uniref:restriction endonuclease subunit S n=1 Tax=Actinacidiphila sp. bgisy160 TaxID=3413796 RepID=UPI003D729C4E
MADPMKLGDFVTLQRGTTYKSRLLGKEGRVLLGLSSIRRNGGFRADSLKRYAGESPEKICVRPGELFVALKDVTQSADLLGAVARVPEEVGVGRLTQDTVKLSFTRASASPNFIHWVLRTPQYRSYCREHALGTTNLSLSREDFLAFPVPAMTDDRLALVELLDTLDDKIAVNERIAAVAMELGAAKFRLCFASTDEEVTVGDVIDLKYGKALPAARRVAGNIPVFGSGGVNGHHNESLVSGPGVIVGRKGTVGAVYWSQVDFFPIDTTFYVACKSGRTSLEYMYFALGSLGLEHMNSDSAVPGLNRDRALSLPLRIPAAPVMAAFTTEVRSLFQLQRSREEENRMLSTLRDTLLPQLMSGRLRVKDAEKIVEDHT